MSVGYTHQIEDKHDIETCPYCKIDYLNQRILDLLDAIAHHKTEKEAFGLIHSTDDKELWEVLK